MTILPMEQTTHNFNTTKHDITGANYDGMVPLKQ
jgi:hypothetical protein